MPFWHRLSEEEVPRMATVGVSHLAQRSWDPQTSFEELLEKRESTRIFTGELLAQAELQRLTWAIYGGIERSRYFPGSSIGVGTVPSGGGLYPLRLYTLTPSLNRNGWICFQVGPSGLTSTGAVTHEALVHSFLDDLDILEGVSAVYILACDFSQTTQKYANRGYRYALLEAGHAAQNAYLWCAEQGIGVVEIGGFDDEVLSRLLSLPYPQEAPLTTLLVGKREEECGYDLKDTGT